MTPYPNPSINSYAANDPNDILIPGVEAAQIPITVVSGAGVLTRGTVLGKITSGGKFKKSLTASSDGSELVAELVILRDDVDATSGDIPAFAYNTGKFKENRLTFGSAHTADTLRSAFQKRGIHLVKEQAIE